MVAGLAVRRRWYDSCFTSARKLIREKVLELELLVGAEATDYEEVASRDSLTGMISFVSFLHLVWLTPSLGSCGTGSEKNQ